MTRSFMVLVGLGLLLGGCATPLYVNIPRIPGDEALHDPNSGRVLNIQAVALRHLLERPPVGGPYGIELPPGTSEAGYERVLSRLPLQGARAEEAPEGAPILRVAQIRIRGVTGQLDIVRTDEEGEQRLVSAYVGTDMSGWYVTRTRVWQIPVEEALRIAAPATPAEPNGS